MDNHKLLIFKSVINDKFPSLLKKISFNDISTILILQIKGSDVHPKNRHPDFFFKEEDEAVISGKKKVGMMRNKKTQIDITASMDLPHEQSPVTALVTPGPNMAKYHPVELFHPLKKKWITKSMKIQPKVKIANGPAPNQARLLIGGTDSDSWSSELWANMGHYSKDKWGHIIFVRSGNRKPLCFSLPRNLQLEELLLDGGKRREKGKSPKYRHLIGSPIKKSLVIVGENPVDKAFKFEYIYIVTQPKEDGWVKIGKTEQEPKNRLNQYNSALTTYDMNYIFLTSNCDEAEKEVLKRLNQIGFDKKKQEWFRLGSLEIAKKVIIEVIKSYPPPLNMDIKPIIISDRSWAY